MSYQIVCTNSSLQHRDTSLISTMELDFSSFPILFTSFIFMYFMAPKIMRKRSKSSSSLPPGPWKIPFLGNMHHFFVSLPHRRLRDLAKEYGPLMHIQLGQMSAIVVSSPEAAHQVLKTHDLCFAQRPFLLASGIVAYNCTSIAFSPYGDYWKMLRKICITELLSPKCVQSFRSIREEEVSKLVGFISSNIGSTVNLSRNIFSMTFGITSLSAFGRKFKDQEEFIPLVKKALALAGGFSVADAFPSYKFLHSITGMTSKLEKIHQKLDKILDNLINEHKSFQESRKIGEGDQDKDLLDVLLNWQKQQDLEIPLTNDNIKAVILDVFFAGSETSSIIVESAMSEMMKNPEMMQKAQAEVRKVFCKKENVEETGLDQLQYLKLVINETMRLHPPGPLLLPRECRKNCEIFGYEIPVKTKVIVNAWAIGRDSRHWKEAERFYPERFLDSLVDYKGANFEFIPFGAGRRICPGMSFGIANVELPLASLLYHFDWKLPSGRNPRDLDMAEQFGVTVKRKNDLCLIPNPYLPVPVKE